MIKVNELVPMIDKDFYSVCETLVLHQEDSYYIEQSGIWMKSHKDIVMRDMTSGRRRILIVSPTGAVLDTNMVLCEECGVPILGDTCEECGC